MKDILDFFKSIAIIPLSICFYFVRINFVIVRQVIKIQPDFIKRLIRFCINKSIISCLSLVYYPLILLFDYEFITDYVKLYKSNSNNQQYSKNI